MTDKSERAVADALRRQMVTRWWDDAEANPDRDAQEVTRAALAASSRQHPIVCAAVAAALGFTGGIWLARR